MNRVFEHPKFLADGKVNPLAASSDFVLVFIDDILTFSKSAECIPIFDLVCDASQFGLGRFIAFWSRKMVHAEQNYHITEQELLADIEALKAFWCYVDGIPFNLVTDHIPNTFLDTQPTFSRRQTCWSEYLQRFSFTQTNVADPWSRDPSHHLATSLVAHALRAQLCVTTRSKTIPTPVATPVTSVTSPVTPSNPFDLATDTVIPEDMGMEVAEQPMQT